jgi:hypothetical protein
MQEMIYKEELAATTATVRKVLTQTLIKASKGEMNHYDGALVIGAAKQINYNMSNELKHRDQQIKLALDVPKLGCLEVA